MQGRVAVPPLFADDVIECRYRFGVDTQKGAPLLAEVAKDHPFHGDGRRGNGTSPEWRSHEAQRRSTGST